MAIPRVREVMTRAPTLCFLVSAATLLLSSCTAAVLEDGFVHWADEGADATSPAAAWDGDSVDEQPQGPLHPDTILIEQEPCFADVSLSDNQENITLDFNCEDSVPELAEGRILAGRLHGGYLRRISQVERPDPYTAVLNTEPATLAEAVVNVELQESWSFGARELVDFSGRVLDEAEGSSVVVEHGTLRLQPELDLDAELGFLRLKRARADLTIHLDFELDASFEASGPTERSDVQEISTHSYPLEWQAGILNGSGSLDVVIQLGFRHANEGGAASGRLRSSNQGNFEMIGTWERPDSWTSELIPHYEGSNGDLEPLGSAAWEAEVFLVVEATMHLDGVEGSTFKLHPFVLGAASGPCGERDWSTRSAIDGEVIFRMDFFDDGPREDHLPPLDVLAANDSGTYEGVEAEDGSCSLNPEDFETGDGEAGDDDPVEDDDAGNDDSSDNSHGSGDTPLGGGGPDGALMGDDMDQSGWAGQCLPTQELSCGDIIVGNTLTSPTATSAMNGYPCNVGNYDGPELVYEWTAPSSGTAEFSLVDPRPTELNQDVFVLDGSAGECSSSLCLEAGSNSVSFPAVAGQTYLLVVDGFAGQGGAFQASLDCTP